MEGLVVAERKEFVRPLCPECGSGYILANGPCWLCKECGKQFTKNRRTIEKVYINKPPCPECASGYIISRGEDWQCRDCGRKFRKQKRRIK